VEWIYGTRRVAHGFDRSQINGLRDRSDPRLLLAGWIDSFTFPGLALSLRFTGAALLTVTNLDEHIYSGEATRSSLGTVYIDAIRDVAQLTRKIRQLQSEPNLGANTFGPYNSSALGAASKTLQAGGQRFAGIHKEWVDHISVTGSAIQATGDDAAKKQWMTEEETFIRRVMNQLMEAY
jgi:hypothetical protein